MGYILQRKGNYKEALENYKKTVNIAPEYSWAYKKMGDVLSIQEKYIEAIKAYKKAIEIQPDFAAAYNALTELSESKMYKDVKNLYRKAIDKNHGDIALRVEQAEYCLIAGGFNRALDMANELLADSDIKIDVEYRMAMTFIDISASFFLEEKAEAIHKASRFIKAYENLPGDYSRSWSYAASKRFISKERRLTPEQRQLLLLVIETLESPRPKGMKKLPKLREAIHAVIKSR
jgi:tetratricopeptide (TPR) repeat protein